MRYAAVLLLVACNGDTVSDKEDTDTNQGGDGLVIDEPPDGASVAVGDKVHLAATVDDEGATVTWSAGDWTADGNDLDVSDLPVGKYDLVATAGDASDSVAIEVRLDGSFVGTLDMDIDWQSDSIGEGTLACEHESLELEIDMEGNVSGSGACVPESVVPRQEFAISGTVVGMDVEGEMVTEDTPDDPLPYSGSSDTAGTITATFDKTWENDAGTGSFRLYGSFTASPE